MNYISSRRISSAIFFASISFLFAVPTLHAESYTISGSADGTGTILVDDGLRVTLNGVEIHNSVGLSSGMRQPIPVINANVGDQLRFAVHDTFGDCRSLSRLVLTDSVGRFAVIFPGWSGGCQNPIDTGEVFSETVAIPILPSSDPYSDVHLPGPSQAGLTQVPDGRLFGITYEGGNSNKGTLYYYDHLTKDDPVTHGITIVHHFTGQGDGEIPYHGLVYDSVSRKLYGTTSWSAGGGTIFSYDPATNAFNTLIADFGGRSAPQSTLVVHNNQIYGVLQYPIPSAGEGGPAVFRVATNGTGFTVIHEFDEYGAMPQNIVLGADNKLYGVNLGGGSAGCWPSSPTTMYCGQVFSLNLDGSGFQVLKQFQRVIGTPCPIVEDCANSPQTLLYGSDGWLYGATYNDVFRLDPNAADPATTIQFLYTGSNGVGVSLIEGADGRLYSAYYEGGDTYGTGQIFSMNRDGTDRTVLKEFTTATGSPFGPYGKLFQDAKGNIYGTTEYIFLENAEYGTVFFIAAGGLQTAAGANVSLQWPNTNVVFQNVTVPGVTRVTEIDPSSVDATLPVGYAVVPGTVAYEINTTATFTGNITVCLNLPNVNDPAIFAALSLFHGEGGALVDVTSSRDFATRTLCGVVTSLSPFVIGQPAAPTPTPSPEPTPTPTPEPTPTPTPEPTPSPTPTPTAPAAPSNLVADSISSSATDLTWHDNSNNETNFELERCDGKGKCRTFFLLAVPGENTVIYHDTGLSSGSQYSYRIRAVNAIGNSGYSNVAKARTSRR